MTVSTRGHSSNYKLTEFEEVGL